MTAERRACYRSLWNTETDQRELLTADLNYKRWVWISQALRYVFTVAKELFTTGRGAEKPSGYFLPLIHLTAFTQVNAFKKFF